MAVVYKDEKPAGRIVYKDEKPTPPRRRSPLEYASGLASAVNQGMTLGFADEIQAGAEQLLSTVSGGRAGAPYRESLARQRGERESFAQDNPWASGLATGAGAAIPSVMAAGPAALSTLRQLSLPAGQFVAPVGGFTPLATDPARAASAFSPESFTLLRQSLFGGNPPAGPVNTVMDGIREGARAGVLPGFVGGVGTAEPGQRLEGGITGGIVGGFVGGTVGGTMQAAQNTGQRAGRKVEPYLRKVAEALGIDDGPIVSRAVPGAPGGSSAPAPITAAEARILRAMEEGGVTPEAAAAALQRAREAGVPLGLVDVGGQPILREARAVRTLAGEGSRIVDDALAERAAGQSDRVIGQLERGFARRSTADAGSRADALLMKARADSGPLYRQLDSLPDIEDPAVLRILQTPFMRERIQSLEAGRMALGQPVASLYDEAGNLARPVTFRDVDAAKQMLDEALRPAYQQGPRPAGAVDISTRAFRQDAQRLRNELVQAADSARGGELYARARQSYAGPAQARDAFEAGREMIRRPTELADVRAEVRGASPAERKWYERGALEALRGRIEQTPDLTGNRNVLGGFYGNRADRAKVLEVVNPRRRGLLDEALMLENRAAQTRNFVASGSQTADKLVEATDQLAEVATDAATGNKVGMLSRMGDWLRDKVGQNTRAEIARQLTNFDDPAVQQAFLQRLIDLRRAGALQAQDVQAVARAMTTQTQTEGQ